MARSTDPDIETARAIACATTRHGTSAWKQFCREGAYDDEEAVQTALIGIKVGRGLDPLPVAALADAA